MTRNTNRSHELYDRARRSIPGGVNSPVRAFRAVGGDPIFFARAQGAHLWDVDGNEYIDYVSSWGPCILGHAPAAVLAAIGGAAAHGTTFGAPTELEVCFAEALRAAVPSLEKVRCVSSGTEATMSALRLARGATGREKIVKIDGGYHGHADCLLVAAGSGAATLGIPGSAGVPAGAARDTLLVPFGDLDAVRGLLAQHAGQVAAMIVEPVLGNIGVVPPPAGYLEGLRAACDEAGTLLIFDEVITGFRVAFGGAQARYAVRPDLTCLGKIIGGGLPAAAYGGRADLMDRVAPDGPVYQAGTLSGNPLAMAAGLATLAELARPGTYARLEALAARLEAGLGQLEGVTVNRVGSMMTVFFTHQPVVDYASAKRADAARYGAWFRALLERGIYLAPSQFEAAFVSLAHTEEDIDRTLLAGREALAAVSRHG
jgi:glutamate-1-semialdehyde 2,1-aminomutase